MKKVSLRLLTIEIGRNCNLKCRHCYKGDAEAIGLEEETVDALLDNVYFIDELSLIGGEITLHTKELKMLLNKLKARNIKVNWVFTASNFCVKSEEFVKVWNDFVEYSTNSKEARTRISMDKYHMEFIQENMRNLNIEENVEWYKQHLVEHDFEGAWDKSSIMLDDGYILLIEGRAKNLAEEELGQFIELEDIPQNEIEIGTFPLNKKCCGDNNICGYGCVYNCIPKKIFINVFGDVFPYTDFSYTTQRENKKMCMGNIKKYSIYDMIEKWNYKLKSMNIKDFVKLDKFNEFNNLKIEKMLQIIKDNAFLADKYSKIGEFENSRFCLSKCKRFGEYLENIFAKAVESMVNHLEGISVEDFNEYPKYIRDALSSLYLNREFLKEGLQRCEKNRKDIESMSNILEKRITQNIKGTLFRFGDENLFAMLVKLFYPSGDSGDGCEKQG